MALKKELQTELDNFKLQVTQARKQYYAEDMSGEYTLNLSDIRTTTLDYLLSIYRGSEWQLLFPLRAEYSKRKREAITEFNPVHTAKTESVCIRDIGIGDQVYHYGFVGVVAEGRRYPDPEKKGGPWVYQLLVEYVAGDLDAFKCLLGSINNGCNRDYRAVIQGNNRVNIQVINYDKS